MPRSNTARQIGLVMSFAFAAGQTVVDAAPVPNSPFLKVAYNYADAVLKTGRDVAGPQKSGLFLSALDRSSLGPLTNRPAAPAGVDDEYRVGLKDGPLVGANAQHDENLIRLMYALRSLSQNLAYEQAGDNEIKWVLENACLPDTQLLAWGLYLSWDTVEDKPVIRGASPRHEFLRPWVLLDRGFELAPEASKRYAFALLKLGTGDESREGSHDARSAGIWIRTWAVAYANSKDRAFIRGIEEVLDRFAKRRNAKTGLIQMPGCPTTLVLATLSMAIDCEAAAAYVPEPLASRLREFAAAEDRAFCSLSHDLKTRHGFAIAANAETGQAANDRTPLWENRIGTMTTAGAGLMCAARYENVGNIGYRDLITDAADAYMKSLPDRGADTWPLAFGQAISLELAAWRASAKREYIDRATELAHQAVQLFWEDKPLPRASLKSSHYETITGADTLALSLVELHLSILHITAVPMPTNTLDR